MIYNKKTKTGITLSREEYNKLLHCLYCGKKSEKEVCADCNYDHHKCAVCEIILRDKPIKRYIYFPKGSSWTEYCFMAKVYYEPFSEHLCRNCFNLISSLGFWETTL